MPEADLSQQPLIYLDVSAAVHRRAGLGRYAESLTRALVAAGPDRYALFYNRERGVEPLAGLQHLPARSVALGYKPWRMLVWLGQLAHVGFERLIPGAALFHATEHLLLPLRSVPSVLTVHDLIFHHLPEHHKPLNRLYLKLALPLYCRRAHRIIAVSEHTRQDVIRTYGISPDKVVVIYEAADPRFCPQPPQVVAAARARYGLPERYVLFVGTIEPRKNLSRLLDAFAVVHREGLTDALVIVGRKGWLTDEFFARLEAFPLRERVLFPGYVPDDDLPAIYAGAQVLALPSLHEGFGLPLLEAQACGVPVVASDAASLPEIGGTAARYFPPADSEAMTQVLRAVLADPPLQAQMRTEGLAQAARFSWARAAKETAQLYHQIL